MTTTNFSTTALITGASRGLGRALAIALGAAGLRVVLVARNAAELDPVVAEVTQKGGTAFAIAADVGDKQAIHRIAQAPHAARQFGRLTLYGLILADRRQFSLGHVPSKLVLDGGHSPLKEVNDAEDFVDGLIGSHRE